MKGQTFCLTTLVLALVWVLPQPAMAAEKAKVLIVTGVDYPGHHWRETSPVLAEALRSDRRVDVTIVEDPAFLDSAALDRYQTVVLHFQNWEQPGPGSAARQNLRRFVEKGGGLALVHFACGAWHGEWEDFVELAGRVWGGPGPNVRQHDPFGLFSVEITSKAHAITRGMKSFEVKDELYTCLVGDRPIEVLAEAKSKVDEKLYPMAFITQFGKGRTFHCVLGHNADALRTPAVSTLFRRGIVWTTGLSPDSDIPSAHEPK